MRQDWTGTRRPASIICGRTPADRPTPPRLYRNLTHARGTFANPKTLDSDTRARSFIDRPTHRISRPVGRHHTRVWTSYAQCVRLVSFGTVSIALHYRHHVARRPAMLYELQLAAKRPRQPLRSLTTPIHELANTAKYDLRCLLRQPPLKPTSFSSHLIIAPTLPRLLCLLQLVNIRLIQQEKGSGIHTQNSTSSFELIFKGVSACGS
jgi:hypothetical protein